MGIGELVSGAINASRSLPTTDLSALFDTINKAGAKKEEMIKALPESLKPLYEQYKKSLSAAGATLEGTTKDIGQNLLDKTTALYDPNSAAVQATLAALKQQDYSTLPGTLTALKAQLAGSGGLSTGGAGRAITQAVLAPAAQYSQQAADVQAQQLNAQQTNVQAALNKIASMDETTARALFGMSTQEAQTILTSGRDDLKSQLSDLINNIDTQTSQTLGLQGFAANEAQQNALTRLQQKSDLTNMGVKAAVDGLTQVASMGASGGASAGLPAGADVSSMDYMRNALANAPAGV